MRRARDRLCTMRFNPIRRIIWLYKVRNNRLRFRYGSMRGWSKVSEPSVKWQSSRVGNRQWPTLLLRNCRVVSKYHPPFFTILCYNNREWISGHLVLVSLFHMEQPLKRLFYVEWISAWSRFSRKFRTQVINSLSTGGYNYSGFV